MSPTINVMIVSLDRLLTEALAASLAHRADMRVMAPPGGNGSHAGAPAQVDVVLVDATLDPQEALARTRKIRERFAEAKIMVLGLEHEDDGLVDFVEAGAVGYVLKGASLAELTAAIEAVQAGQTICSPEIASSVLCRLLELAREEAVAGDGRRPVEPLTGRELEVLQLVAGGLGNKEIARRLNITVQTVKNHVHNLLGKIGVHHRREAVRAAYELGLLEGPLGGPEE